MLERLNASLILYICFLPNMEQRSLKNKSLEVCKSFLVNIAKIFFAGLLQKFVPYKTQKLTSRTIKSCLK